MSDYVVTTNFGAKDALAPGNPSKVIKGTEFTTEFDAIAVAIATKTNLASPTFTGTPAAPTAAVDTNTTQIATTAYVIGQGYAKLASPVFTGAPLAPTAAVDTNTTQLATTAYVIGQGYLKSATAAATYSALGHTHSYLPLAGGTLTGSLNVSNGTLALYGYAGNNALSIIYMNSAATKYIYQDGTNYVFASGGIAVGGGVSATTGVFSGALTALSLQATSSRELKQNIRPRAPGALERVLAWDVSEYEFKDNPGALEVGLVAEDADPIISTGKAIKTNVALFELAAAVQELARKVH